MQIDLLMKPANSSIRPRLLAAVVEFSDEAILFKLIDKA
jgi:hypothetical protein